MIDSIKSVAFIHWRHLSLSLSLSGAYGPGTKAGRVSSGTTTLQPLAST